MAIFSNSLTSGSGTSKSSSSLSVSLRSFLPRVNASVAAAAAAAVVVVVVAGGVDAASYVVHG